MIDIKDFSDICRIDGIDIRIFDLPDDATKEEISDNAYNKLKVIVRVLNGGWKPDWGDYEQYKHYPYFKKDNNKFICYKYGSYCIGPVVGSRLVYKSLILAEFAVSKFMYIYNDYLSY